MKASVIREMTDEEVQDRMTEEKAKLVRMKQNHAVSPLENPAQISMQRKVVARFNTESTRRAKNQQSA